MHEHRVVHGLDQALKQLFAIQQPRTALFEVVQQRIDGGAELAQACRFGSRNPMRPAVPLRVRRKIWSENSLTARSWRRLRAYSTASPTARVAEMNQSTMEDKINADLDGDES